MNSQQQQTAWRQKAGSAVYGSRQGRPWQQTATETWYRRWQTDKLVRNLGGKNMFPPEQTNSSLTIPSEFLPSLSKGGCWRGRRWLLRHTGNRGSSTWRRGLERCGTSIWKTASGSLGTRGATTPLLLTARANAGRERTAVLERRF